MLKKLEFFISKLLKWVGVLACGACLAMLVNVFYDAIARYFLAPILPFPVSSIGMQELEWHFFAVSFMFGMVYTLREDGHVRVDILYERFSPQKKAIIDTIGFIFFVIPFFLLVAYFGFGFASQSFGYREQSGDPGGLPYRFIVKSLVFFTSVFMVLAAIEKVLKNIRLIRDEKAKLFKEQSAERGFKS